jgi:hypothetical protein
MKGRRVPEQFVAEQRDGKRHRHFLGIEGKDI